MFKRNSYNYFFYFIVVFGLILFSFSNPFLRYPYDAIAHLIAIDEMYNGYSDTTTSIQHNRLLWHSSWANFFHVFHLDSIDMFLRAKIIHIVQGTISFFTIYYFANVLIRNLFYNISKTVLQSLSLWAVIIWLSIFATYSVHYHQVWIMWYSVNYQITLPLSFYIVALTLVLFLEDIPIAQRFFFILQIMILSSLMIRIHMMEFMYYLMYMSVFIIVYLDKIYKNFKKYYPFIFLAIIILYYVISKNLEKLPAILTYLKFEKLPLLYDKIMESGNFVVEHLNRSCAVINELVYVSLFLGSIVFFIFIKDLLKKTENIHYRLFIFLLITSIFILIPLNQYSAGLFALITRLDVVHRLYYSSSIFVLLPVSIYYISKTVSLKLRYLNLIMLILLFSVYGFSKYNSSISNNYYKNIESIKNSFDKKIVGFNLNQKQIKIIGDKLKQYKEYKNNIYYARPDIAFVLKYIYKQRVFWKGRRINFNYINAYKQNVKNTEYNAVLFDVPIDFPIYRPYL